MNQPITANELVKVTGYEKRDVYQLINELIMKHDIPVAGVRSGQAGYLLSRVKKSVSEPNATHEPYYEHGTAY